MIISGSMVRNGMVWIIWIEWFSIVLVSCEKLISIFSVNLMLSLMVKFMVVCVRLVFRCWNNDLFVSKC